jgi:DeoR family fructose operon transcriptional repressor
MKGDGMYATERHEQIESLLATHGRVSVVSLAERFDVTTETIRRDLDHLEAAGALRRVHGGAVRADRASTREPSVAERLQHHGAAKAAIGRRALDALGDGFRGSVFIDAGTTTAAVAAALAPHLSDSSIEVVTHSLTLGNALAAVPGASLTFVGGRVRGVTAAAVGADTVRSIAGLRPDVAFVGTNGVSAGFGLSTPDPDEAAVKRAIVGAARRVVVVADAEKHDSELLVGFAELSDIDVLVTDAGPGPDLAAALDEAGVEVWLA